MHQTPTGLAQHDQGFQVVHDLYYASATVKQFPRMARECGFKNGGLSRKRAIQLIEFFDCIGDTRRVKDMHLLRSHTQLFS